MQRVCFNEHGENVNNPITPSSSLPCRWAMLRSQQVYNESSGITKGSRKEQSFDRLSPTMSLGSPSSQLRPRFELGHGQPMVFANCPYMDHNYGLGASYGVPATGWVMLPCDAQKKDGAIYVNAKQYNGIMRRRQSRARAELENKTSKVRKPYLHESRHLHAKQRARGCGGRFLAKSSYNRKGGTHTNKAPDIHLSHLIQSPSLEVLQSVTRHTNSSEFTSMYANGHYNHFQTDHLHSVAFSQSLKHGS